MLVWNCEIGPKELISNECIFEDLKKIFIGNLRKQKADFEVQYKIKDKF